MAPSVYDRQFNFQNQQALTPSTPLPAEEVDAEFNAVKVALDSTQLSLSQIQRSDGALANDIVTQDSLSPSLSIGFNLRGAWAAAVNYVASDGVTFGTAFYRAKSSHLSVTGQTPDIRADLWDILVSFDDFAPANVPDGSITTAKLAAAAVTTAKIADANVTTAKIADANVTTAKIADANVTTAKIADASVTPVKLVPATTRAITSASSAGDRTLVATDAGKMLLLQGSSNFTLTADAASVLGNGWAADLNVTASVIVTIDPNASETIDGATTITLAKGQTCRLVCTGSAFHTLGLRDEATLLRTTLSASASSVECEIPPGYLGAEITGFFTSSSEQYQLIQLSNNGGSSWTATGYLNVNLFASAGGGATTNGTGTTGLVFAYGALTIPSPIDAFLNLADATYGISLRAHSMYFSGGTTNSLRHSGFYNAGLVGVNRIRLVTGGGTFSSGSRILIRGLRG